MKLSVSRKALAIAILVGVSSVSHAEPIHAVKTLPGYQCMVLAKLWDGEGPQPPPVHVFAGPGPDAPEVGIAGGSIIVPSPEHTVNDRTEMLFANGRTVWIGVSDIAPFHVVSNPHASCTPVLLSNGRYGFQTKH